MLTLSNGVQKDVKNAAYYKAAFKKATTIKALHTKTKVLFTIRSLRNYFVTAFNVYGTNEKINKKIIRVFRNNLAHDVDNVDASKLKDNVAIILPGIKDKNKTPQIRLDIQLKKAIKTVCSNCKERDIKNWFVNHQFSLEKSIQANSGIDEADDNQPLFAPPPPRVVLVLGPNGPMVIPNYDDYDFVEIQKLREQYNRGVEKYKK
jgi:hypothetical protein